MGGCLHVPDPDLVQSIQQLSRDQAEQRLLDGYLRRIKHLHQLIPMDVKSLLIIYLQAIDQDRRLEALVSNYIISHILLDNN